MGTTHIRERKRNYDKEMELFSEGRGMKVQAASKEEGEDQRGKRSTGVPQYILYAFTYYTGTE